MSSRMKRTQRKRHCTPANIEKTKLPGLVAPSRRPSSPHSREKFLVWLQQLPDSHTCTFCHWSSLELLLCLSVLLFYFLIDIIIFVCLCGWSLLSASRRMRRSKEPNNIGLLVKPYLAHTLLLSSHFRLGSIAIFGKVLYWAFVLLPIMTSP